MESFATYMLQLEAAIKPKQLLSVCVCMCETVQ